MDFTQLYLFELILMRMTGFVEFSPFFGRTNVPVTVRAGFSLVLSVFVFSAIPATVPAEPRNILEFTVIMLIELCVGLTLGLITRLYVAVIQLGGHIIDTQMGFTMAQVYDPSSMSQMSVTASMLNILFVMVFFAQNGHYTLTRIMLTSSDILPYGTATFAPIVSEHIVQIFLSYTILSVKLALPIMAAELLGVIGMGILMKAIPQINAFVINIDLKVLMGLAMMFVFIIPISEFIVSIEVEMMHEIQNMLAILSG